MKWMHERVLLSTNLDEFYVVIIRAFRGRVIQAAGRELVAGFVDDVRRVEIRQHGEQQTSIPVIRDTTPVVTLARHVADGVKRNIFVLIYEHLKVQTKIISVSIGWRFLKYKTLVTVWHIDANRILVLLKIS